MNENIGNPDSSIRSEYTTIFMEPLELIASAKDKLDQEIQDRRDRINHVYKWISNFLEPNLRQATLPMGVEYRFSLGSGADLTMTISELDSFMDLTEVLSAIATTRHSEDDDPRWSKDVHDDIPQRCRTYSYWGYMGEGGYNYIRVVAYLGAEAQGCKVRKKYVNTSKTEYVTVDTVVEEQSFICPDDPEYDDF